MADDGSDAATIPEWWDSLQQAKDWIYAESRRGGGRRGGGRRGGATTASKSTEPMVTRSGANASRPMVLFSNTEFSESNDDDFNASKQGDEDAKDDWMH